MSITSREEFDFGMLILEALEGNISKDHFEALEKKINSDPAAAKQYLDCMMNQALLMWRGESLHADTDIMTQSPEDTRFLCAMGEYEKLAPAVEIKLIETHPRPADEIIKPARAARQINKFSLVTAVASLAALVFMLVYVYFNPARSNETVAAITDSIHAVWSDTHYGSDVRLTEYTGPLELKSGCVKIVYDYGTEVIVEGPALFEVLGPEEMSVSLGKVYVSVPPAAIGFTVNTRNTRVVDLGTEFGVISGLDGITETHVFKGQIAMFAGPKNQKSSVIVKEGLAKRVNASNDVSEIDLKGQLFARKIDSASNFVWRGEKVRINLADVVGGGNGLGTGKIGQGISLTSGSCVSDFNWTDRQGNGQYLKVNELPFVDGVIVPDSEDGTLRVSSEGHLFRECPNTNGLYFDEIRNGGLVRMTDTKSSFPMLFNSLEYGTSERPLLFMHSNACITFNLDAMRKAMPGFHVTSFRSRCVLIEKSDRIRTEKADVFVLVNGETKFKQVGFDQNGLALNVDIPLTDNDRFLTLAATDGNDSIAIDWVGFAEPYVLLEADR
jgi:hypothetical protein